MTAVRDQAVTAYLDALRSTAAVPGGGSAAALAGAMGSALVSMVAKLSARKKQDRDRMLLEELVPKLDAVCTRLLDLSQQDIEAYRAVIDARKAGADASAMEQAYEHAAEVPLTTAETAADGLRLARQVSDRAWEMTASDLAVGNDLLEAALAGALGNVEVNLPELKGETAARIERRYQLLRGAQQS